ncbi:YkyA family protein [Ornithinibacillus halophilus]|uniref:Putative cell-wall binding lipoprotein n=1 Tax=Ornithinibacillus halophilus TaxID=930117 RepID=A0A1M5I8E4_9BACI|nr:YkyA family protein [Ornithinibacillus halophilus]SHG24190.1 Putative cell-wall binding lipoprotein [Ornithinibacillus halophilus]
MRFKKTAIALTISMAAILTACGESVDTEIYNHLEEAVTLEEGYEEQQETIAKLEKQEQEIYSQIIELGIDDFDQIKELSKEALAIIAERQEKIDIEKESIDSAREEFLNTESLITEIEEEKAKETAEKMYQTMEERYNAYDDLYQAYSDSLSLEEELYTMLQSEDIKQEEITEHIQKVNSSYQTVIEANNQFNEYTVQYNDLKKEYYEIADINVSYSE